MTLYLVRHAVALARRKWNGRDELRPLTGRGRRQADGLIDLIDGRSVRAVYSSPAVRCVDTVQPLARARGLDVVVDDRLAEGSGVAALPLLDTSDDVVLCAHGDNLPELLLALAGHIDGVPHDPPFAKGATWMLDVEGGKAFSAAYLEPPA